MPSRSLHSGDSHFDDVRMRGFRLRTCVDTALEWIDQAFQLMPPEEVPLAHAVGRVLAAQVVSQTNVPSFRRAMMDGYALHAADTLGATSYNPLKLRVVGAVMPGDAHAGSVAPGEAVRIMTGAAVPEGADAVLPAEMVTCDGTVLTVLDEVPPEKHIGRVGEDIRQGATALRERRRLRPQDLGILSSLGVPMVTVFRRPRVRLIVTGNELVPPGSAPGPHQTADANGPMLSALVDRDGGRLRFDGITPDDPASIRDMMEDAAADIVIVSGGSSVGQEDHAPRMLAELGELAIHGVAMRPSSPTGMGRVRERLVFLLPGNPVSCLCAYDFFAGRAIRLSGGRSARWPYRMQRGVLKRKISSVVGRLDYARVAMEGNEIVPLAIAGASVLSSTSRADGFVTIPSYSEGYPPGTEVEVYLYDGNP